MNKNIRPASADIIETILVLFLLLALLAALYDVLHIFFGIFTFALIFSVSFEGIFERVVLFLKNRRKLTAFIYSMVLIAVIAVPLGFLFLAVPVTSGMPLGWLLMLKTRGFHHFLTGYLIFHLWASRHQPYGRSFS